MSVTLQTPYIKYTAAATATSFATGFRVILAVDLQVKVNGSIVTSGFTLSGLDSQSSVTVTFSSPMTGGEIVELQRIVPRTRVTDYQQLGDFMTPVVNADFDRIVMMLQDQEYGANYFLRLPDGDASAPMTIPALSDRLDRLLAFNETTGQLERSSFTVTEIASAIAAAYAAGSTADAVTFIQSGAGAVARSVQNKIREHFAATDFEAAADGVTNDRAKIAAADAAALSAGRPLRITAGTYRIGSALTIASPVVFEAGAILKPDAGITVTFSQNFTAPTSSQIFDLSNAGALISLPYNLTECWAEWWGANGNMVKTDNHVPINQALAAMGATASGGSGVAYGTVRLGRGFFLVSGTMNMPNGVSLRGVSRSYTAIKANAATWSGSIMFNGSTGATPLFDSRLENLRIDAGQIATITYAVYSDAWQEKCGLRNVLMLGFMNYGMYYTEGYGGAASLMIEDCEIFPDDTSSNSTGVFASNTSLIGRMLLNISRTTIGTGNSSPSNVNGVHTTNLVDVVYNTVHFEGLSSGHLLAGGNTSASGSGVTGGPYMAQVFNCASTWTGSIDVAGFRRCGATSALVDSNRAYDFSGVEPVDGHLQWPPSPTRCIHSCIVTGGASPVIAYQDGIYSTTPFASVAHTSTGTYLVTLNSSTGALTNMDGIVTSQDNATPMIIFSVNTVSSFYVITRNTSGTLTDCAGFSVKLFHKR